MTVHILSMLAVAGAWLGGLGIIFSVTAFCFGIIRPGLFRHGLTYLLVADVGFILMLAALIGIINDNTLWVFSIIGLILLIGFTVAAFVIVRGFVKLPGGANTALETARRRIEF